MSLSPPALPAPDPRPPAVLAPPFAENVTIAWDLARERLTLGGALLLRQEAELLARRTGRSKISLFVTGDEAGRGHVDRMARIVFDSSAFTFQVRHEKPPAESWPAAIDRAHPQFSYFSFERIVALHRQTALAARLRWSAPQTRLATQARARFAGRLIGVHLRSVAPFSPEESNADGPAWNAFFARHARPGSRDFLLLGDDHPPAGLSLRPGVARAIDLGLDLATQLALVGVADGFLGMASGVSAAANLSDPPHVIFKHPAHHPAELARELGAADRFPFAGPRQWLWRRVVDAGLLDAAFALISA